jgi:NADPH:quinone reductase-like Zn-dependent oxidoreductase
MTAVVLTKHGDFSVLQVQERPSPALRDGQVRIKVHAAGVNFADTMARVGLYPDAPKPPCVVGYEVAGEIVEGENVGARVIAGTRFGGYADEVVVKAQDTFPLPDDLSFEQGAAIPVNYVTAYAGLLRYGNLQPGEKVLLHAAAGGVGIAATQIAKHSGAEIWGTASPAKHDAIRGFGVDHAVDYTQSAWEKSVPKVDLIMDAIGGASFRTSYNLLNPGGRLIAFGASAVMDGDKRNLVAAAKAALRMPRFNLIKQMTESKAVIGLNALTLWDHAGTLGPWMASLQELFDAGVIQPVVSDAVPFANAGEAHRIIAERRNVGKVVLVP